MAKENENVSLDFRLKKIDETRNCFLDEIKHNDLMNEKHKKGCRALNYFEHFLISVSAVSGCVSISAFASFAGVPVGIASSAVGLKFFTIIAEIKTYNSIIKKKKMEHDKIVSLGKTELNIIKVLISKAPSNS